MILAVSTLLKQLLQFKIILVLPRVHVELGMIIRLYLHSLEKVLLARTIMMLVNLLLDTALQVQP